MAKINFYLDKRSGSNGKFPLKFRLAHKNSSLLFSAGVNLREDQWNIENSLVINYPASKTVNTSLIKRKEQMEDILLQLRLASKLDRLSIQELKDILINDGEPSKKKSDKPTFMERLIIVGESKRSENTRDSYRQTVKKLRMFDPDIDSRTFEEIDKDFLARFDAFLSETSKTNSKNVYYRNMRTVFNDAIDEEITTSYPFRKFKIKAAPTKKRSLTVEELRVLRDFPGLDPHLEKFRDIFMLMFYLCGINAIDLFNAKKGDLQRGRLEYIRAKTGKQYSIKVEPEAQILIDKYRGEKYLIDICEDGRNYRNYLQRMSHELKNIGTYKRKGLGGKKIYKSAFPDLSQYWCRHTWATLAAELDIPKETIAAGLGHDMGNTTTAIYINFNQKKVDDANRKVIDFVNEK